MSAVQTLHVAVQCGENKKRESQRNLWANWVKIHILVCHLSQVTTREAIKLTNFTLTAVLFWNECWKVSLIHCHWQFAKQCLANISGPIKWLHFAHTKTLDKYSPMSLKGCTPWPFEFRKRTLKEPLSTRYRVNWVSAPVTFQPANINSRISTLLTVLKTLKREPYKSRTSQQSSSQLGGHKLAIWIFWTHTNELPELKGKKLVIALWKRIFHFSSIYARNGKKPTQRRKFRHWISVIRAQWYCEIFTHFPTKAVNAFNRPQRSGHFHLSHFYAER